VEADYCVLVDFQCFADSVDVCQVYHHRVFCPWEDVVFGEFYFFLEHLLLLYIIPVRWARTKKR